ncbi:MAG TPA: hypothetical protein DCE01_03315 [Thermodesulfobacterium commune]|uniref:Uncharacterized protein n=1 Tax=Thermodesulfobacterium commune TaxID=1741 RepID=A0A3B8N5Y1_9BACT|nr:hypothetical protein [Thermodesulfobacterium commune]
MNHKLHNFTKIYFNALFGLYRTFLSKLYIQALIGIQIASNFETTLMEEVKDAKQTQRQKRCDGTYQSS